MTTVVKTVGSVSLAEKTDLLGRLGGQNQRQEGSPRKWDELQPCLILRIRFCAERARLES